MSLLRAFLFSVLISLSTPSWAQWDPRQIMAGVIQQFQTGTPNPTWYSQPVWYMLALQTNNSGYSPQLASLGPVQDIQITGQIQLPAGPVYSLQVRHAAASYTAQLGISYWTNRIEYITLNPAQADQTAPAPLPPSPLPTGDTRPQPQTQPTDPEVADSEACRRFPNLC